MSNVNSEGLASTAPVRRKVGFLLGVGIFLLPIVFAWVTLRQGYSVLARAASFIWLLLTLIVAIAASSSPSVVTPATAPVTDASLPTSTPSGAAEPAAAETSAPKLDMAAYSRIKTGMTYAAVRDIVGVDGEEMSSSDLAGIRTAAYTWKNSDGSNMMLIFQRGKLASKAQFGLR